MELVIDANILFSALIKDGVTVEILFNENLKLFAPEFLFKEFKKYEKVITEKTSRTQKELDKILMITKELIVIQSKEEYQHLLKKAKNISPDHKDAPYFALALKLNCPIWSNDKKLKEQNKVKVHSTHELLKILH